MRALYKYTLIDPSFVKEYGRLPEWGAACGSFGHTVVARSAIGFAADDREQVPRIDVFECGRRVERPLGRQVTVPIYPLFRHLPFDPRQVDLMSRVFEQVSLELRLAEREDQIRDIVAQAIIECAQRGIRDHEEMRRCAHEVIQSA